MFWRRKKAKAAPPSAGVREKTSLFMDLVDLIVDLAKVVEDVVRLYRRWQRGRREEKR